MTKKTTPPPAGPIGGVPRLHVVPVAAVQVNLTPDERALLGMFRAMGPRDQKLVLLTAATSELAKTVFEPHQSRQVSTANTPAEMNLLRHFRQITPSDQESVVKILEKQSEGYSDTRREAQVGFMRLVKRNTFESKGAGVGSRGPS